MLFSEFPFLRYVLFFIAGVLLYPWIGFLQIQVYQVLLVFLFVSYLVSAVLNRKFKKFAFRFFIPLNAYLLLILLGIYFSYSKDIKNESGHIYQQKNTLKGYLAVVKSVDQAKANSTANLVSVLYGFDGQKYFPLKGEILIYHRADEGLLPGEVIWISGMPQVIAPPNNPAEFNYKKFMLRQQISHQHFINNNLKKLGKLNEQPIENFFLKVRAEIEHGMDRQIQDPQAKQVAKALLLGQKKNMDKELNAAYAATGAMHILAVSGLHVGIVYGFFFLFIKPYRLPTGRRICYLSLIILLIWGYAFLTGMSPSVMRAATMFSLMALAQMKSRNPSIFNAIALSALLLLMFDPFLLYAVGFQLSYVALIGILLFQPILVNLWLPKNKVLEYAWQITTVGIAAQLATFPVSVYYFHMFPSYFILSNLVAIPGAFLIMSFGIPFMLLVKVPYISEILARLVEMLIQAMNQVIFAVQQLPKAQLTDIHLDKVTIFFYAIIFAMLYLLATMPKKWQLYVMVGSLLFFGIFKIFGFYNPLGEKELIIYASAEGKAIDFILNSGAYFWQNAVSDSEMSYKVLPNRKEKNPDKSLALKAFGKADSLIICLPDQGEVSLIANQLSFSNLQVKKVQQWQEENWEEYVLPEPIILGSNALKIVLK